MNDYESETLICILALVTLWSKAYNIGIGREPSVPDASFTIYRVENIRRVLETAKLMIDAGLIVLVSFISPFRSEREMARLMVDDGEFLEVFIDTPLEECERRDVNGLYKKQKLVKLKILQALIRLMNVPTMQK